MIQVPRRTGLRAENVAPHNNSLGIFDFTCALQAGTLACCRHGDSRKNFMLALPGLISPFRKKAKHHIGGNDYHSLLVVGAEAVMLDPALEVFKKGSAGHG